MVLWPAPRAGRFLLSPRVTGLYSETVMTQSEWMILQREIIGCERCARLRDHCQEIARVKRAAYREEDYWGRPVPDFGDPDARLLIVGLAPGAHGANRTGRMFTGDRSGDFLYRHLHEAGYANQTICRSKSDGLELRSALITAAVRCAPPGNKPTAAEFRNCAPYLERLFDQMADLRGVVALGKLAFDACIKIYRTRGWLADGPRPRFGHGLIVERTGSPLLVGCYHPSQQNTFTGRLTPEMMGTLFQSVSKRMGGEKGK